MTFAYLYLSHPDFIDDGDSHPRRHGSPQPGVHPQPDEQPLQALRDFTDIEVMTRGIEITGRVVDQQDQPIAGAEVRWIEADRPRHLPQRPADDHHRSRRPLRLPSRSARL